MKDVRLGNVYLRTIPFDLGSANGERGTSRRVGKVVGYPPLSERPCCCCEQQQRDRPLLLAWKATVRQRRRG